jgi:hypothetical protein
MGFTRFNSAMVNEAPGFVDFGVAAVEATVGAVTYTAAVMASKLVLRDPNGASRADLFPTAAALVSYLQSILGALPEIGATWELDIRNTADAAETITMTTNTGLTLSGTMTIAQNASKRFRFVVTNAASPAVTVYTVGAYTH